jgi:orotidine-5'-phosphate decarboxylase
MYNMDKLYEAAAAKGNVCIGLDTSADYIPDAARRRFSSDAEAVLAFNKAVINAASDAAACFKVQIAYYEALGLAGLETYSRTLSYIREKGSLVIADIKRGDIADTALQYAKAHFEGDFEADFVTLSPYMGMDSIEPWLSWAESKGKGAFVLMRTSNKGMKDFEYLKLSEPVIAGEDLSVENADGWANTQRLYDIVGDKLSELAAKHKGVHGYGAFGAVVGADPKSGTEREEAAAIRKKRHDLFFLIPGYGAQGGAAEDAALLLTGGNGGVVNASRSILKAWTKAENSADADIPFAADCAIKAALEMRDDIRKAASSL